MTDMQIRHAASPAAEDAGSTLGDHQLTTTGDDDVVVVLCQQFTPLSQSISQFEPFVESK